jgi:4-amino-4-deoxy-L-arabinose transferase-like glycosyltransferase
MPNVGKAKQRNLRIDLARFSSGARGHTGIANTVYKFFMQNKILSGRPSSLLGQAQSPAVFAALCIAIFVLSAALSIRNKSSSWDDPYHLTAGVAQLQTGDPRLNADHPPLARLIGAIPSLFMKVPAVADSAPSAWKQADIYASTLAYFPTIEDRLLWPGRLTMLCLSVLLGWLLYSWASELFGVKATWLPMALYAFCPPLLANAPLVTTDMAATTFMFAALYAGWRFIEAPSLGRLGWVSLSTAAAFCAKFTAVLLVPLFLLFALGSTVKPALMQYKLQPRVLAAIGSLAVIGIATVLAINLIYFFDGVMRTPEEYIAQSLHQMPSLRTGASRLFSIWPTWLPIPLPYYYVAGFLSVFTNVELKGHATYFLGQAGNGGWPNYFLMLLLIKLPIPMLILVGSGMLRAFSRLPRKGWNFLFLTLPPLLIISIASMGKMQIGIRHILPALPFLLLLSGYLLHFPIKRWQQFTVALLLVMNAASSLRVHPYYLMYFNFLAGGPEQGWRISITGDDYGQGDADLSRWLAERNVRELAFGGFGWGDLLLNRAGIKTKPVPCEDKGELVAIHAGSLLLTRTPLETARCFNWMRLREPDEKIGYSIFIYNSKNLPEKTGKQTAQYYLSESLTKYNNGDFHGSMAASRHALQLHPHNAEAYNLLCAANNQLKNWQEAVTACEKALKIKPGYQLAKNNLAWAKQSMPEPQR